MQQQLVQSVRAVGALPVNELQWQVAGTNADISDAVANSFGRALKKLASERAVRVEVRPLTSFDEVVKVFPFRSRTLATYHVRQRLLPLLASFEPERGTYGRAENERYVLEHANELRWRHERRWLDIERDWKAIEDDLHVLLGTKRAPRRLIVDVITRGKELFNEHSGVTHPGALGPMLTALVSAYADHKQPLVVRQLSQFYQRYVPRADLVAARLFSKVLSIVNVESRGADTMRTEAAEYLLEQAPKIVRALPGHKDRSTPVGIEPGLFDRPPKFSKMLDKVLTKEALQEFRFVTAT